MKTRILLILALFVGFIFALPKQAYAIGDCNKALVDFSISGFETPYGGPFEENFDLVPPPISVSLGGLGPNKDYEVACVEKDCFIFCWDDVVEDSIKTVRSNSSGGARWVVDNNSCWGKDGGHKIQVTDVSSTQSCFAQDYVVVKEGTGLSCTKKSVVLASTGEESCYQPGDEIDWEFQVVQIDGSPYQGDLLVFTSGVFGGQVGMDRVFSPNAAGTISGSDTVITGESATEYIGHPIVYQIYRDYVSVPREVVSCKFVTAPIQLDSTNCDPNNLPGTDQAFDLCNQIPEKTASGEDNIQRQNCLTCFDQHGIWTAIGCIDTSSTEGIVSKLMTVGMSIAGGIALLMILASAFLFATSEGEPKRTGEAKEILTSAIIGLIFIIFSVTILQFIGVDILKIPGFGE